MSVIKLVRRHAALFAWIGVLLAGLSLTPASAFAQGAVQAYPPEIYGHATMFGPQNNSIMDGGGPMQNGQPPNNSTNPGTSPLGYQWVNSGLGDCGFSTYANTTYSRLCWGFDGNGNGLLTIDGFGTTPTFNVRINGQLYPITGSGGNVVGPPSSTTNHISLFADGTGKLLSDSGNVIPGQLTLSGGSLLNSTALQNYVPIPGGSANAWGTPNLFSRTITGTHNDQETAAAIVDTSTGSGTNGPNYSDAALTLSCIKANYLTSVVQGERDCLWSYAYQGVLGDGSLWLGQIYKVDGGAGGTPPGSYRNYGISQSEVISGFIDSKGDNQKMITALTGNLYTGAQNISAAANNGSGAFRLTIGSTIGMANGDGAQIVGVQGVPQLNTNWVITVIDATHVDLQGSTYVAGFSGTGGTITDTPGDQGGPGWGYQARANYAALADAYLADTDDRSNGSIPPSWNCAFGIRTARNEANRTGCWSGDGLHLEIGGQKDPSYALKVGSNFPSTFIFASGAAEARPPSEATPSLSLVGNFLNGAAEVGFWNTFNNAAVSFDFEQATSSSASTSVARFSTTGATFPAAMTLTGLATGGTYTKAACLTSAGSLQGDTSGTICGISAARFKNLVDEPIDPKGLLALRTEPWRYKPQYQDHGQIEHVGLIADDVAKMDPRCAIRDETGKVVNYSDRCIEAYLVAMVKAQQVRIDKLEHRK
jgi:hypothetical protein